MIIRVCLVAAAVLATTSTGRADDLSLDAAMLVMRQGGLLMWAILASSIIGCFFLVERLLVVRRGRQIPRRLMSDLRDAMVSGGVAAGIKVVEGSKSAMGKVMFALLSRSGATRRELENIVDDEASRILGDLRTNMRPIGIMATVAPQLGLLGTVFGLIAAFRAAAEFGMDDPSNFAAGIYEALYTTAFGLVVAIPLLVAYYMIRNAGDSIMREVEERSIAFIMAASSRAETQRAASAHPVPARVENAESEEDLLHSRVMAERRAADDETTGITEG